MDSTRPQEPTRWLTFWSLIRLPLGAGVIIWQSIFLLSEPNLSHAEENIGNANLVIAWFLLLVSAGLRKREARAFEDNWYIVFGEPVLWVCGQMMLTPTTTSAVAKSISLLLVFPILLVCWCWPNYIYFKKREHLFH